ncbi:MAG: hypothetical protein JSU01_21835 [Bacteroidetes bacterium]|nr:hypothetical protein [Bacteroidota bacterium]
MELFDVVIAPKIGKGSFSIIRQLFHRNNSSVEPGKLCDAFRMERLVGAIPIL